MNLNFEGNHIKVRLNGGRGAYEGRLEISDGISWLPVCRNGFTMDSAKVVCKHFGYPVRYFESVISVHWISDTKRFCLVHPLILFETMIFLYAF